MKSISGLDDAQVRERIADGRVNTGENSTSRTVGQIIRENVLTFFNFLNVVLALFCLAVGSLKNAAFMGVIFFNTLIGIVQELRAKRTIDKLVIMTAAKSHVIRNGKEIVIPCAELVADDVVLLGAGEQIPADAVVLDGSLEVNESLLTGESDNLRKKEGDSLYSGSFIVSGRALAVLTKVGSESYASGITREARRYRRHESELSLSLNLILKAVSLIIVPMGILLFNSQYFTLGRGIREAVVSTVAAMVGMIPEGLILLTSITLTLGALYLARRNTLVQELTCIETLARVDTLCLDKTGTITTGRMELEKVLPWEGAGRTEEQIRSLLSGLLSVLPDSNATASALRKACPVGEKKEAIHTIPFSSERKYSGAVFKGEGSFFIGAPSFVFPEGNDEIGRAAEPYISQGYRVLVLAFSEEMAREEALPPGLRPLALLVLSDVMRPEAKETLSYFREQGVDLKVISGDDPLTVSAIAKRANLPGAERYADASKIDSEEEMKKALSTCSVFGRVSPQQKKTMVLLLKEAGRTVAMTGDGVNDVLALKEADCSIAMAEGSDAAKHISSIVLLDSAFSGLPHAVNQGRRVINNIRTAASMFLIKTIFSTLLSLATILFGASYPFEPVQMSLIGACSVGIPTFFLSQENNFHRIESGFLRHVFSNAFPPAVTITGAVLFLMGVCSFGFKDNIMLSTACVLVTGWTYMSALRLVYAPLNRYRRFIIYGMQLLFFALAALFQDPLGLRPLQFRMVVITFALMIFAPRSIGYVRMLLRDLERRIGRERLAALGRRIRRLSDGRRRKKEAS